MASTSKIEERITAKAEAEQLEAVRSARRAIEGAARAAFALGLHDYLDPSDVRVFLRGVFSSDGDEDVSAKLEALNAKSAERRCCEHRSNLLNTVEQISDFLECHE